MGMVIAVPTITVTSYRRDSVSNHQPHHCLLNRLYRRWSKKTSKLRVTGLCVGNSPVNSPHKWPGTRKMFPFDDVIMTQQTRTYWHIICVTCSWYAKYIDRSFPISCLHVTAVDRYMACHVILRGCLLQVISPTLLTPMPTTYTITVMIVDCWWWIPAINTAVVFSIRKQPLLIKSVPIST